MNTHPQDPHRARPRELYLGSLRRPVLTREEEVLLARRVEDGERALLEALLSTEAGIQALRELREELRADATSSLAAVLRNVELARDAARTQRTRLMRTLAAGDRAGKLVERLVLLRLHPDVYARLERAVRPAGDAATLERVDAAKRRILEAKHELVECNLRLVVSFARGFRSDHLTFLDLIQEGNVGLMRAVDKYDYRSGHRLSTYASWWIKQAMQRAITDRAPAIRVPVHVVETRAKVLKTRSRLRRKLGHEPTTEQLAEHSGLPVAKVELVLDLVREPLSLDAPVTIDGEKSVGDMVANDTSPLPEDEVARARLRRDALGLLGALDARERRILGMRFGLEGASEHTLEEIGALLSLSRERVRQIETAALGKLRAQCRSRAFRPDIAS